MRWMIWHGSEDIYFAANRTMYLYHTIWDLLGVRDTIKFEYVNPGQQHTQVQPAFTEMMKFVRGDEE